jgi:NAD(P)H dehydrogenase (quinone)
MPPYLIEAHQRGELDAETDVARQIGGAPPKSLETFIAENHATFG